MRACTIAFVLLISLAVQAVTGGAHAASLGWTTPIEHGQTASALRQSLQLPGRPELGDWEWNRKVDDEFHFLPYFEEPQRQASENAC